MAKVIKWIFIIVIIIVIVILIIALLINRYVVLKTKNNIIRLEDAKKIENIDCILVLGAGVWKEKPSYMLEDRLLEGIKLYKNSISNKMIMSGDHSRVDYDEVNVMKKFAMVRGIKSEDIFMDHAGFSTYESLYRAKEIFKCKRIVIVTQEYHLYRSLYIGEKLGLECYGVKANPRKYAGQFLREIREIAARNKDVFKCIIKSKPTYLGDTIPVSGNGNVTNDKNIKY